MAVEIGVRALFLKPTSIRGDAARLDEPGEALDFGHIGFHSGQQVRGDAVLPYRQVDAGELLQVLFEAIPDARAIGAILAANPARLYL